MSKFSKALTDIAEKGIKLIELRFSDTHGVWQHLGINADTVTERMLETGVPFDGSSIKGWRPINDSDMLLIPDPDGVFFDPFAAQPTMGFFCDVADEGGKPYDKDPRSVAKSGERYLRSTGIGDKAYIGPEPEFFLFDDVRFHTAPYGSFYKLDSIEFPDNSMTEYDEGNYGHRPAVKGGYFPVPPIDSAQDIRGEMVSALKEAGLIAGKHHHEVAPAQHELIFKHATPTKSADNTQLFKYCVMMVAHSFGKSATFMPKPVYGDNGSGMHIHQSIWKGDKNVFAGDKHCGLSREALWYIGGVVKHCRALNAFTNSTTNSYKRLVPGFEAPTLLSYSMRNRSAACRIPISRREETRRIELRFPDALSNPYLAFTAILMAGLDGIQNKIDPGEPINEDLYELPERKTRRIPRVATDLDVALTALDRDRAFLKKGDVMSDDLIDSYIALKKDEMRRVASHPHPLEFSLYYSR